MLCARAPAMERAGLATERFTGETAGREEWNAVAAPSRVRMLAAVLRWEVGELLSIVKRGQGGRSGGQAVRRSKHLIPSPARDLLEEPSNLRVDPSVGFPPPA